MKNISIAQEELQKINEQQIRSMDKFYRMFAGAGSQLVSVRNGIAIIEINISKLWPKTLDEIARQFIGDWSGREELKEVRIWIASIYTTQRIPGFSVSIDEIKTEQTKKLIELMNAEPNRKMIYELKIDASQIKEQISNVQSFENSSNGSGLKEPSKQVITPKVDDEVKEKLKELPQESSQVIVHCTYTGTYLGDKIRIWSSTFLFPHESKDRCKMLYSENIGIYPEWRYLSKGEIAKFTLIFSGLPKSCKFFDMIEKIPEGGAFEVYDIKRNKSDVYHIEIK